MSNIQHGKKRPHSDLALPIAVIVAGILSVGSLGFIAGTSVQEDKPERAVGHLVVHVAQPDPIPPCPKPRPIGKPVTP